MNRFISVSPTAHRCSLALVLLALFPSCHRLDERMEIKETRTISSYAKAPVDKEVSSTERFIDAEPEEPARPPNFFSWATPEGWHDAGPDDMGLRNINFAFGPNNEGECYLSLLKSEGSIPDNVNRWRKQMGLQPSTPEEIEQLPKTPLLNHEATSVMLDGDFTAVGAATALKGYRLVGLVLPLPQAILTVKMTGPKDLVEKNMAGFEEFVQSLGIAR